MSRKYRVGSGLPDMPPVPDEQLKLALRPLYQAVNDLAKQISDLTGVTFVPKEDLQGVDPLTEHGGYRSEDVILRCVETIQYGSIISTVGGGTVSVRLASASDTDKPPRGVCVERSGGLANEYVRVRLFRGLVTDLTGLLPGRMYYLWDAGQITSTVPTSPRYAVKVGLALSESELLVDIPLM